MRYRAAAKFAAPNRGKTIAALMVSAAILIAIFRFQIVAYPTLLLAFVVHEFTLFIKHTQISASQQPHTPWPNMMSDLGAWYKPSLEARWRLYQHDPPLQHSVAQLALLLLVGGGILLAVQMLNRAGRPRLSPHSATHGSQQLMRPNQTHDYRTPRQSFSVAALVAPALATAGQRVRLPKPVAAVKTWADARQAQAATPPTRLPLGEYAGQAMSLSQIQRCDHVLLVAGTGRGKTSLFMKPALLAEQGENSVVVPDQKGDMYRETAGLLAQRGLRIWRFAPTAPRLSHRYNPLAYVTKKLDAQHLAVCLLQNTGGIPDGDPYWTNIAQALLTGAVMHLRKSEPGAPLSRLFDLFIGTEIDEVQATLASSASRDAREKAKTVVGYIRQNEKLVASVMSELSTRLDLLHTPEIRAVTRTNDLDFARMIDTPTALFITIPALDAAQHAFLSSCLMMQMFTVFQRIAEAHEGLMPRAVNLYLDEFTNMGHIPDMAKYVSMLRSTGVSMMFAIQSFAQLDDTYGERLRRAILVNTGCQITLPGAGIEECRYFSERLGETTVANASVSEGGNLASEQRNWGEAETRRLLLQPAEIRTLPRGQALVIIATEPGMIVRPTPYYEDPDLLALTKIPAPVYDAPDDVEDDDEMDSEEAPAAGEEGLPE